VNLLLNRGPTGEAHVAHLLRSKLGKRLADWSGSMANRPIWSGVRCGGESWALRLRAARAVAEFSTDAGPILGGRCAADTRSADRVRSGSIGNRSIREHR